MRKPRQRWKPAGAVTITDKDRLGTIFLYSHKGAPAAIGYAGRKTKHSLHITCATHAQVETMVRSWLDGLRNQAETARRFREHIDQDEYSVRNVSRQIRASLAARGYRVSVTHGRGTAYGWIHIDLLPAERKVMTPAQRREAYLKLSDALGIERRCFTSDSISVPSAHDYYREYLDRAAGRVPAKLGTPYWD